MVNVPLTSQVRMVASFPAKAQVIVVSLSEAQRREAAPLCSGTANPHWHSPFLQALYEPVFPQQIHVTERERAVHRFGKYCLSMSAGSDRKQIHLSSKVKMFSLSHV